MSSNYMTDPIIFLIDTLASLYILAVFLRFLLQWCNAEFYNPISQFLVKVTHPPLKFLRRFIPSIGKIDTSSIVLLFILQLITDFIILTLKGVTISIGGLTILSLSQLLSLLINIFIFSVFARAILSWLSPGAFNAASSILVSLTEPVLTLARKLIPDLGGIDLSPLVALLGLQLIKMLLLPPLQQLTALIG